MLGHVLMAHWTDLGIVHFKDHNLLCNVKFSLLSRVIISCFLLHFKDTLLDLLIGLLEHHLVMVCFYYRIGMLLLNRHQLAINVGWPLKHLKLDLIMVLDSVT